MWQGKVQRMVFNIGIAKECIQVLKERGKYHPSMKVEDMRQKLASNADFKEEKTKIEHFERVMLASSCPNSTAS